MAVETYNEKIVVDPDDGYGYRISEGDVGELVLFYFEYRTAGGKTETEVCRIHSGIGEHVCRAMLEKFEEMEDANER